MDKRPVAVLSTIHDASMTTISRRSRSAVRGVETIRKPHMIVQYNMYMGGVDIADQLVTYYRFCHHSKKWWKRAFFHLLEVCVVNAYILYSSTNKVSHLDFILTTAKQLLVKHQQQEVFPIRAHHPDQPRRLIGRNHFPEPSPGPRDCCVCSKRPNDRKCSSYQCNTCKVSLCLHPCFKNYHTLPNYK